MVLSSFRVVLLPQISRTLCVPLERVIQGSYRGYKRLLVLYQLRCTELCHVIAVPDTGNCDDWDTHGNKIESEGPFCICVCVLLQSDR